jgi:hypothetical protein
MNRGRAHCGMTGKTTPLYVVCSPCRRVGKTLVSRLLTEFYVAKGRLVAAFDLADEGPQLTDYLPGLVTRADIGDVRSQMALFDRLVADRDTPTVIDVGRRAFTNFFTVVHEISFFEEARRRSIEPRILFITDPNATKACATLAGEFTQSLLLPVYNQIEASTNAHCVVSPNASMPPLFLDIPLLGLSLRALVDQPSFSFSQFSWTEPAGLPQELDIPLRGWLEYIFSQVQNLECSIGYEDRTPIIVHSSKRAYATDRQRPSIDVPAQVLKCVSKQERRIEESPDLFGNAIVAMLQKAAELSSNEWATNTTLAINLSHQLRVTENRIKKLQSEIEHFEHRAVRAETWIQWFQRELRHKLITQRQAMEHGDD